MGGYVTSCVENIQSRDEFKWLSMRGSVIWENLIWYDNANYGGFAMFRKNDEFDENSDEMQEAGEGDDTIKPFHHFDLSNETFLTENYDTKLMVKFNIAHFLPQAMEIGFITTIGEYLHIVHSKYLRIITPNQNEPQRLTQVLFVYVFLKCRLRFCFFFFICLYFF